MHHKNALPIALNWITVEIKRPLYVVILLFEKFKGVIKDHPKKSEIKIPKIDPIFDVFSEASEVKKQSKCYSRQWKSNFQEGQF